MHSISKQQRDFQGIYTTVQIKLLHKNLSFTQRQKKKAARTECTRMHALYLSIYYFATIARNNVTLCSHIVFKGTLFFYCVNKEWLHLEMFSKQTNTKWKREHARCHLHLNSLNKGSAKHIYLLKERCSTYLLTTLVKQWMQSCGSYQSKCLILLTCYKQWETALSANFLPFSNLALKTPHCMKNTSEQFGSH